MVPAPPKANKQSAHTRGKPEVRTGALCRVITCSTNEAGLTIGNSLVSRSKLDYIYVVINVTRVIFMPGFGVRGSAFLVRRGHVDTGVQGTAHGAARN